MSVVLPRRRNEALGLIRFHVAYCNNAVRCGLIDVERGVRKLYYPG